MCDAFFNLLNHHHQKSYFKVKFITYILQQAWNFLQMSELALITAVHKQAHSCLCVFKLFIFTTGCPYGRVLQKSINHFIFWRIVQDTDTERCPIPGAKLFSTNTWYLDLKSHLDVFTPVVVAESSKKCRHSIDFHLFFIYQKKKLISFCQWMITHV
jgi:hypothetical protein